MWHITDGYGSGEPLPSAEEEKIEHSEMIDNRAKLHGLMRNAMERVSVPIKKGEGCATLFTFDDDR